MSQECQHRTVTCTVLPPVLALGVHKSCMLFGAQLCVCERHGIQTLLIDRWLHLSPSYVLNERLTVFTNMQHNATRCNTICDDSVGEITGVPLKKRGFGTHLALYSWLVSLFLKIIWVLFEGTTIYGHTNYVCWDPPLW